MDSMDLDEPVPGPTELNTGIHGHDLEVSKDRLSATYKGEARHPSDVGSIQANRPVPMKQRVFYFEITVTSTMDQPRIAIGFTDKNYKLTRQPGCEAGSYGWMGDTGMIHQSSEKGEAYGPKFGSGDTVGAGIHLGRQEIFFTKNGTKLRTAFRNVRSVLYPTVGLHSKGVSIKANFGQEPFEFDLEGMISDERHLEHVAVSSVPVSARDTHWLVHSYLLHYGYAGALRAFDREAGLEGDEQATSSGRDPAMETLTVRQEVRQLVLAGNIQAAMELLKAQYPQVLSGHPGADEVQFHLSCQQYIELVRAGRVDDAVAFAQTVLAGLRHGAPHWETALREVVALIAYERPEESPLKGLMSMGQRERVADALNAAILQATAPKPASSDSSNSMVEDTPIPGPMKSNLEVLLQQLVAVHEALHEANHSQGEVFNLQEHLCSSRRRK